MAVNHKSVAQERQSVEERKSKPVMPKPDTTTDKLQIMQKGWLSVTTIVYRINFQ